MTSSRTRRIAAVVCGTLGAVLILLATLLGYARRSVFDERAFSARVAASLENPHVAEFVAEQIADALIDAKPDLVGLRPVMIGLCRGIVSSAPFRVAARRGARTLHRSLMDGSAKNIVLTVKDFGAIVQSATATNPDLSKKIPPGLSAAIGHIESLPGGERLPWLLRLGRRMHGAAIGLFFLGIALCAASVWLANGKRWAFVRLGGAFTVLGLLLAIVAQFGGNLLGLFVRQDQLAPVLAGLAGAFLGGLMAWAIALGLAGLVLASASASLLDRIPIEKWARAAQHWAIGPQPKMRLRLLRGLVGALVGALILFRPLQSLMVAGWLIGLLVAFLGLREAFGAALHLLPDFEPRVRGQKAEKARAGGGRAVAVVSITVAALFAAILWLTVRAPDAPTLPSVVTTYNGSAALGDRTLDQVMFPTTHNSMGSPDVPGWMFPNQSEGIRLQLEDGIRGFMLDLHYGTPAADHVKTEILDEKVAMAKYEAEVGKEGMEAAIRIRDRMTGAAEGKRGVYMCHGFCELGALELVPVLEEMDDFLEANPGEVILIIFQDEGVSPQDIERCFEESGLIEFVYRGPARAPWPTLREMVAANGRVLVMTENNSAGVEWIHPAFDVLQETPYGFHSPTEFSNGPNRGGTGGSILLMNHWIESTPMPKPSNALLVNARDALRARIKAFERIRGRAPNLVAVDFYREGDLIEVVREYNAMPLESRRRRR